MKLPAVIQDHLHNWVLATRQPFCMRVTKDQRLAALWGPAQEYGFGGLQVGQDVADWVPFLADYGAGEQVQLPFVVGATGIACHIHLIPAESGRYVLYIDAREELAARQRSQQTANEVRLLMEQQQRLLSQLVDAQAELTLRRKEAEDESRRRGEYIATMSHEFRTPLASVLAQAEQLAANPAAPVAQAGKAIDRVTQQLLWLIDNLLLRARLDSDGFAIHPVVTDLRRMADDLCLVFAPLAADKELSFAARVAADVPDFVLVDDLHLRQVLVNLLGNAIKYTASGAVELTISWRAGRLTLAVSDSGPGIPADERSRLIERFERGRNVPRVRGAGLGLNITRQLLDAMSGTLQLESAGNGGTCATVALPARSACELLPHAGDSRASRQTVLVGEDDPDLQDLLTLKLTEAGYAVHAVGDGAALVDEALALRPDIIIVDTNMPELDGPSAARALREQGVQIPIVALSGATRAADIDYALSSGCTEFLRKPPHVPGLVRLMRELTLRHAAGKIPAQQRKQM